MEALRKDFLRFSRLHSWYKHIPIEGAEFYVYQDIGEQPRNSIDPEIKDQSGMHWHICRLRQPPRTLPYYKVRLGPFLQGVWESYNNEKSVFSFNLILRCNEDNFLPWIATHYPEWKSLTMEDWQKKSYKFDDPILVELFTNETNKYWKDLVDAIQLNDNSRTVL